MTIGLNAFLFVAGILFSIGFFGLLRQRNSLILLMCVELMLNAINLMLISFSKYNALLHTEMGHPHPMMGGNLFVFFIITVAAAEVAIGLALAVALYRKRESVRVSAFNLLHD